MGTGKAVQRVAHRAWWRLCGRHSCAGRQRGSLHVPPPHGPWPPPQCALSPLIRAAASAPPPRHHPPWATRSSACSSSSCCTSTATPASSRRPSRSVDRLRVHAPLASRQTGSQPASCASPTCPQHTCISRPAPSLGPRRRSGGCQSRSWHARVWHKSLCQYQHVLPGREVQPVQHSAGAPSPPLPPCPPSRVAVC